METTLKSFLHRDLKKTRNQKRVSKSFKNFLKTWSSYSKFKKDLLKMTDTDVVKFRANVVRDIADSGNYQKFLNFCNYTTDKHRILIMCVYHHYFGGKAKRTMTTITTKGIVGKALKSKARKTADKGTIKEYTHKIRVPLNEVTRFIKFNGARLRAGLITEYETEYSNDFKEKSNFEGSPQKNPEVPSIGVYKAVKQKKLKTCTTHLARAMNKNILADYKYLRPYGFKYARVPEVAAFAEKQRCLRLKGNKRKRAEKFEEKSGHDWSLILEYLGKVGSYVFSDGFGKASKSEMTVAFKVLKLKRYADFEKNISGDAADQAVAKKQATLFVNDFKKKMITYTSVRK